MNTSHSTSRRILAASLIVTILLMLPQALFSQQRGQMQQKREPIEVSDQELEEFVEVQDKMIKAQNNARQKMIAAIEDEGLDLRNYNKITKQMRNAESMDEVDAPKEQVEKARKASQKIMKIRQSMNKEQQQLINDEDISLKRYQEIEQASMQDPELQKRIQKIKERETSKEKERQKD